VNFCEIEQDATFQRAIDYVKPTLSLEQGTDGLSGRHGRRVIFSRKALIWPSSPKPFPAKPKPIPIIGGYNVSLANPVPSGLIVSLGSS